MNNYIQVKLTLEELRALVSAAESMVEIVSSGNRWQNEPPETLADLRSAATVLLAKLGEYEP